MRKFVDGEKKAATVIAPAPDATAERTMILFTLDTTHASHALPPAWSGKYVRITPLGGNVWFSVSVSTLPATPAGQEVDRTVAAGDGTTAQAKLGKKISAGDYQDFMLPVVDPVRDTMFFNREGDVASQAVEVVLVSP